MNKLTRDSTGNASIAHRRRRHQLLLFPRKRRAFPPVFSQQVIKRKELFLVELEKRKIGGGAQSRRIAGTELATEWLFEEETGEHPRRI